MLMMKSEISTGQKIFCWTVDEKPAPDSWLFQVKKGSYHCSRLYVQCQINGCTNKHIISDQKGDEMEEFDFGKDI